VDEINRSVTVEWQEEEEVKGKEVSEIELLCQFMLKLIFCSFKSTIQIDFDAIFDLNPNLSDSAISKNETQGGLGLKKVKFVMND
jgi:hypothetical protein